MATTLHCRCAIIVLLVGVIISSPHTTIAAKAKKNYDNTPTSTTTQDGLQTNNEPSESTQILQQKQTEHSSIQQQFNSKLSSMKNTNKHLKYEFNTFVNARNERDKLYDKMDIVGSKVTELIRRTEKVLDRVEEYNVMALKGATPVKKVGDVMEKYSLEKRLENVIKEELARRERYGLVNLVTASVEENATDTSTDSIVEETEEGDSPSTDSPYITIEKLQQLLSSQNVISPSESTLQASLTTLSTKLMNDIVSVEDGAYTKRGKQLNDHYENQFASIKKSQSMDDGQCLSILTTLHIVSTKLEEHYYDGINLIDHATYENGASVVYELTSSSYVPPPRNSLIKESEDINEMKRTMYDEQIEDLYHQKQEQKNDEGGSLINGWSSSLQKLNIWKWYTSYKFDSLRQYLPSDWERALDTLSLHTSTPWSDYTPRGAIDALIPDYVYHSLGLGHLLGIGRTVSPEVAISAGYTKSGSDKKKKQKGMRNGGWVSKPMGQCYPLSMRNDDDPALSLLSRRQDSYDYEENIIDEQLLIGPKYTIRLPYAVHIDSVSIEHRSFPLPSSELEKGLKGGESAPHWVRVVGFPPCPQSQHKSDDGEELDEEDECNIRGFDLNSPINLGTVEYQRVTVAGLEDDYGGSSSSGDDGEAEYVSDEHRRQRRRSIQTFAVKGGKLKPKLSDENESGREENGSCSDGSQSCGAPFEEEEDVDDVIEEALPAAGQCAPPKDEDSLPSCGGEDMSSQSTNRSSKQEPFVVKAVSFIIEENWGNADYTCLYRVRVHGDAFIDDIAEEIWEDEEEIVPEDEVYEAEDSIVPEENEEKEVYEIDAGRERESKDADAGSGIRIIKRPSEEQVEAIAELDSGDFEEEPEETDSDDFKDYGEYDESEEDEDEGDDSWMD